MENYKIKIKESELYTRKTQAAKIVELVKKGENFKNIPISPTEVLEDLRIKDREIYLKNLVAEVCNSFDDIQETVEIFKGDKELEETQHIPEFISNNLVKITSAFNENFVNLENFDRNDIEKLRQMRDYYSVLRSRFKRESYTQMGYLKDGDCIFLDDAQKYFDVLENNLRENDVVVCDYTMKRLSRMAIDQLIKQGGTEVTFKLDKECKTIQKQLIKLKGRKVTYNSYGEKSL